MLLIWLQFRALRIIGLVLLLGFTPLSKAFAHDKCSVGLSRQADVALVEARQSWPALLRHQKAYRWCDDGALGEGYSDAVTRLLAERWDQFGTFATIAGKNPSFGNWAVKHIDESASEDDLKRIVCNTASCANDPSTNVLCKTVRRAAADALTELKQTRQQVKVQLSQ